MTSIWKLFYYSPPISRGNGGHPGCSWFFRAEDCEDLVTLGGCRMSVVLRQLARKCLHCFKPFHSYPNHLEMLRHTVHTPFWLVLMEYQAIISYQKFSVTLLFMQKKIADFSKLPLMLKSTLDHLNSIRESDASWCTAAETAISNLETEHGITIKGSRGPTVWKSPPLSVQQFRVQVAIPTLIHG